jgi:hypothetical protein
MLTIGIDVASLPAKTSACRIEWDGRQARVLPMTPSGVSDDDIRAHLKEGDKVGLDVPLGWPDGFVGAVGRHRDAAPWQDAELRALRFRRTDEFVRTHTGLIPLSVSTDLIGVTALRMARLLGTRDRSGAGVAVEVYPAAALKIWGFRNRRYKGTKGRAVRAELVEELRARVDGWLDAAPSEWERFEQSDDAFDALIASLVARACAVGRCARIPEDATETARREGWIALPDCDALEHLADAGA